MQSNHTSSRMAPTKGEAPIKGLAAHKPGLELKPFEYTPAPLGPDDMCATLACITHTHTLHAADQQSSRRPALSRSVSISHFLQFKPLLISSVCRRREIVPTHNGLCHSDVHILKGEWGEQPLPKIPGHEVWSKAAAGTAHTMCWCHTESCCRRSWALSQKWAALSGISRRAMWWASGELAVA